VLHPLAPERVADLMAPINALINDFLAPGKLQYANFFRCWIAHIMQKPMKRTDVALGFCGGDRAYYRLLFKFIVECVFGEKLAAISGYYYHFSRWRFSDIQHHKLLICITSMYNKRFERFFAKPTYALRQMSCRDIIMPNFSNVVFQTDTPATAAMMSDTNLVIFDCSYAPAYDYNLLDSLKCRFADPDVPAAFFQYFSSIDLADFDPRRSAEELAR
jgi:hypothetical protein